MSKIGKDFKQYGFFGFLKRIAKWCLRMIGIRINSYYFMVNDIDYEKQKSIRVQRFDRSKRAGL